MRRLLVLVLFGVAVPLFAQSGVRVTKIQFRSRIPASILLSQSLLKEGRLYTDDDLRLAVARIRRIPFVYSATYAVEGSTLVIDVIDQRHLFYQLDTLGIARAEGGGGGSASGAVGGRYAMNWGGVVQGSVGRLGDNDVQRGAYSASYSQYGIAGLPIFGTVSVNRSVESGNMTPMAEVGYPLTLRQTLFARFSRDSSSSGDASVVPARGSATEEAHSLRTTQLSWQWDTTNDPRFGTRGLAVAVGRGSTSRREFFKAVSRSFSFSNDQRTTTSDWTLDALKLWPVGRRGAFLAAADVIDARGDLESINLAGASSKGDIATRQTFASVGYVFNFFSSIDQPRARRHRLELAAGLQRNDDERFGRSNHFDSRLASLTYLFRHRLGDVRLGFSYQMQ